MAPRLNVRIGLTSVRKPEYATEVDYVRQIKKQCDVLKSDLEYVLQQFEDVTPEITIDALRSTLELAKHYTPKLTGELRDSAFIENRGFRGQPRVEIGFAKGGVPRYAALVHEQVEVKHQAPTRSKFLEAAVNEDIGNVIDRVYEGYRRFMGV
jgi:hypothetical protein